MAPWASSRSPLSRHWLLGTEQRRDRKSPPLDGHGPFHCEARGGGRLAALTPLAWVGPTPFLGRALVASRLGVWVSPSVPWGR